MRIPADDIGCVMLRHPVLSDQLDRLAAGDRCAPQTLNPPPARSGKIRCVTRLLNAAWLCQSQTRAHRASLMAGAYMPVLQSSL